MTSVVVVIPYYQLDGGVLRRALRSVASQALPPDVAVRIVVVDDGSPAPVDPEAAGLCLPAAMVIEIVRQPNQGVSAARQAGLQHAAAADLIAFLDSDDTWRSDHLSRACAALEAGADLYFSDHGRQGHHASIFTELGFPPSGCEPDQRDGFRELDVGTLSSLLLNTFAAHLSSVVYRRSVAPEVGFDGALKLAGEDRLFVLEVLAHCRRVLFDDELTVTCGEGVNIYYSRLGWSDDGHLGRELAEVIANRRLLRRVRLNPSDARRMRKRISDGRRRFAYFALRWTLLGHNPFNRDVSSLVGQDLWFAVWFPLALVRAGAARAFGRRAPGVA